MLRDMSLQVNTMHYDVRNVKRTKNIKLKQLTKEGN